MAVFAIGDLHLSLSVDKPMDIFSGWQNYVEKIEQNWLEKIKPEDTVVLLGDTSWAMSLSQGKKDFEFIDRLPGTKYLIKGNHDYWWDTVRKMENFFQECGLNSLKLLHNNAVCVEGMCLCGTRGWLFENGAPHDSKILAREAGRLELSIRAADKFDAEKIVFMHYPPVYADEISGELIDVLLRNEIKRCYYGHIHSSGCRYAINGLYMGIDFQLLSSDHLRFNPVEIVPR